MRMPSDENKNSRIFYFFSLERAKVLRVGRRNVDGDVVGVVIDGVEALLVVGERVFDRGHGVLADVDFPEKLTSLIFVSK